ncbi:mechanosensitive ion channel family protein [Massilia sp. PAMC28688]|uniref:mechanosensitive ion channel family protein n=1 Tax=Massilia sp. PAMC28688 TaxID=2861283 RepID=UPI001C63310C|nr:mechanosensitive ion channel family protein [Massilia sp. PAMC28688]QYF92997.1 mechanosensitive ion channel family protein [Massilia sp. PAMC28688]
MNIQLSIAYERLEQLGHEALRLLPGIGIAIVIFILFLFVARWTRRLVQHVNERRFHHNLVTVLGRMAQWGIILVGLLLAITIAFPSFTPANLISALGITGIAIGFAFKDIFENFLAGILILITEPFRIDDQIIFGAFEGTVETIETRATMIRTYDGRLVVIPNAELFKGSFIVNTAFPTRRLEYDVTIGNGDDILKAKDIMLGVLDRLPGIEAEPAPDALVIEYADSGVTIRIRWWIKPPRRADALDIRDQVLSAVKAELTRNGIDLPYPTHQILLHDQTEDTDGDRARQREGWPPSRETTVSHASSGKYP